MKRTKKRLLALFVSLCMVLTVLPVTAFATGLGTSVNVQSITIGEKTVDNLTGTAETATSPEAALTGSVELEDYANATLKVKLADSKTLDTDGKMKYYVGDTCSAEQLSDTAGTADLTDDTASLDLGLSKGKFVWIYVKPNESAAEYIKITVTLTKTPTPTFSGNTTVECDDESNNSATFHLENSSAFDSKGATFEVFDELGSSSKNPTITAKYTDGGELKLSNTGPWSGEDNKYTVKATIGDHPESDASAQITVKAKTPAPVEHPTNISGQISIDESTGVISCAKTNNGTMKAVLVETDPQSKFDEKISDDTWDKTKLKAGTVKTDLGISSGDFAAMESVKATAADKDKWVVVIEEDGSENVIAVGYKDVPDVKPAKPNISDNTKMMESAVATTVTFTDSEWKAGRSYKVYTQASDGDASSSDPAISNSSGTITLTFTAGHPERDTQYYIASVENTLESKDRTMVTVQAYKAPETVTPTLSTNTTITCGDENVTIELTSDKTFKGELTSEDFEANFDSTGLSITSGTGGSTTATLTLSTAAAKPGTITIAAKNSAFQPNENYAEKTANVTITIAEPTLTVSPSSVTVPSTDPEFTVTIQNGKFDQGQVTSKVSLDGVSELSIKESVTASSDTEIKVPTQGTVSSAGTLTIKIANGAIKGIESEKTVTVSFTSPSTPTPSTPTTPSTTVDEPTTAPGSSETVVDVNTGSTLSGTTANATLSGTNMDKAVDSAVSAAEAAGTAPVVKVDVKTSDQAKGLNVTLPTAPLEELATAVDSSLVITSDVADVALDNAALTALADQAAGTKVTLQVAPVADTGLNADQQEALEAVTGHATVDISMVSGSTPIHDYKGGKLTITLPYALPDGADEKTVTVYYLGDAGELEKCDTSYAGGKVTFTTTHLSKYVVGVAVATDVTLAVKSGLAVGVDGGEITLTATGAAFAGTATAADFTLSDKTLTVTKVAVAADGATATLTVTGTPANDEKVTVTVAKEAFTPNATENATAEISVSLFQFYFDFENMGVDMEGDKIVVTINVEVSMRGEYVLTIPVRVTL